MASAASPTSRRYGNIRLVSLPASPDQLRIAVQPGAMTRTIHGASSMPSPETTHRTTMATPVTARTIRDEFGAAAPMRGIR